MTNSTTYTNGQTTIKTGKVNGEWLAVFSFEYVSFPTKEKMVDYLTANDWKEVEETKSFSPYTNDGLTDSQRMFKIRSNMSFQNRG